MDTTTKAVSSTFNSLKIDEWLIKQIKNLGYSHLLNVFPQSMIVSTWIFLNGRCWQTYSSTNQLHTCYIRWTWLYRMWSNWKWQNVCFCFTHSSNAEQRSLWNLCSSSDSNQRVGVSSILFSLLLSFKTQLMPNILKIADQFQIIGKPINLRMSVIVGGMGMMDQGIELSNHPHIVIATPGR